MSDFFDLLLYGDMAASMGQPMLVIMVMLMAFCVGQVIGWVYIFTHASLSYSRSFVASLVVIPVIVSLVMVLMAGNIVVAFGLLAVFAVIRFRNVLKDTRDTTFVLWAIIQGMAVGTLRISTALVGCGVVALVFLYLRFTSFGIRHRYDVVLNLHWIGSEEAAGVVRRLLRRHSVRVKLASQRDVGEEGMDLSYRLLLRDPNRSRELLHELQETQGVATASLYHREDESEI